MRLDGLSPFLSDASGNVRSGENSAVSGFFVKSLCERRNENAPGVSPRAFAFLGRSERPISHGEWESVRRVQFLLPTALRRGAVERRVAQRPRRVLLGDVEMIEHGKAVVGDCVARTMEAHDTREKFVMQDRSSPHERMRTVRCAHRCGVACASRASADRRSDGDEGRAGSRRLSVPACAAPSNSISRRSRRIREAQSERSRDNSVSVSKTSANSACKVARCARLTVSASTVRPSASTRSKQKQASPTSRTR